MLTCWSIKDRSRFLCILYNCVPVGYNKLLFRERYIDNKTKNFIKKCTSQPYFYKISNDVSQPTFPCCLQFNVLMRTGGAGKNLRGRSL